MRGPLQLMHSDLECQAQLQSSLWSPRFFPLAVSWILSYYSFDLLYLVFVLVILFSMGSSFLSKLVFKVFEGLIVWGELFMQPNHCADKATLNPRTEAAIGWWGLAMEFLEVWGGLLERTGRKKRGFPELAVQEKPRREDLRCRLFAVFGCMKSLSQFLPPEFLLHQNNLDILYNWLQMLPLSRSVAQDLLRACKVT